MKKAVLPVLLAVLFFTALHISSPKTSNIFSIDLFMLVLFLFLGALNSLFITLWYDDDSFLLRLKKASFWGYTSVFLAALLGYGFILVKSLILS